MTMPNQSQHPVNFSPKMVEMLGQPRLLVVDLESTCGPGVTAGHQEVIELGYCVLDFAANTVTPGRSLYVQPRISKVTDFCTELTGIEPEQLVGAPAFAQAVPMIAELIAASGASAWVSWGAFDHQLMHRQTEREGLANPFADIEHFNAMKLLAPALSVLLGEPVQKNGMGLGNAFSKLDLVFEGRAHSGAVDAQNTAALILHVGTKLYFERWIGFRPGAQAGPTVTRAYPAHKA